MEDDSFLDDDLDDIPDNTFAELERNAISSTQRMRQSPAPQPSTNLRKQAHNTSSLYRSHKTTNNLAWRPPRPQQPGISGSQSRPDPPSNVPDMPSSDYGFDDENVIDLDEPSMVIQPASGPPTRVPSRSASRTTSRSVDPETAAAFAAADAEMGADAQQAQQWGQAPHLQHKSRANPETSGLLARIAELEAEKTRLQRLEEEARKAAATKQGEISIVRAKEAKAAKEFERRLAVMQQLHADEAAKQKAELDAMRKQSEKMETDNRFLQHDLAQEAEKLKRTVGSSKARAVKEKDTPRKRKQGLGDGFDDDEVQLVSPSRSREKGKDQTPSAGAKRKRSAQDSPLPTLSFMQPPQPSRETSGEHTIQSAIPASTGSDSINARERYELVQRMLNHKYRGGKELAIELLSKHSFQSPPEQSLASHFFDKLAVSMSTSSSTNLALEIARILLGLWSSCLHEKTYAPVGLVLDMLRASLCFELSAQISKLVEEAVPICLQSIDLVITPVVQMQRASFPTNFDYKAQDELSTKVNVDEIVDFLLFLNQSAALDPERIEAFWRQIHFKGSLLILNKVQPIPRIIQTLRILSTSVLDTSFGSISQDATQQTQQERATLDRLITWLFEVPEAPQGEPPFTEREIAELRIGALNVFRRLCLTDHGGQVLAQHRTAIGKLVKFLNGQIGKLYTICPSARRHQHSSSSSSSDDDAEPTVHELIMKTVNTSVRILHHLLHTFDNLINLTEKLGAERGGYHFFLISMSRVAFSEQLVFEAGIQTEVIEAAHDILDSVLSPEEGEAIVKAVETPRGTRSTTTRKDASGESQEDAMQVEAGDHE